MAAPTAFVLSSMALLPAAVPVAPPSAASAPSENGAVAMVAQSNQAGKRTIVGVIAFENANRRRRHDATKLQSADRLDSV